MATLPNGLAISINTVNLNTSTPYYINNMVGAAHRVDGTPGSLATGEQSRGRAARVHA